MGRRCGKGSGKSGERTDEDEDEEGEEEEERRKRRSCDFSGDVSVEPGDPPWNKIRES
jgi:hypothetical protein